jgi:hypothetical protein
MSIVNHEAAYAHVQRIEDPVTRELVRYGLARAVLRFVETEQRAQVPTPTGPFDLLFHVSLLEELVSNRDRLANMLKGEDDDPLAALIA